jgi:hypothetical protein
MNNFIFNQHTSNLKNGSSNSDESFYGLIGTHDLLDDNGYPVLTNNSSPNKVLAYSVKKVNGDYKYMIRINHEKKLYNPLSIYGTDKSYNLLSNIARSNILYKEVNSTAFDLYLKFLASKNIAWLNKAEREI